MDTNILIAGLLKDATTRRILLDPRMSFLVPEYAVEELERHLPALAERLRIPPENARLALSLLLERVDVVPQSAYAPLMPEAETALRGGDLDDAPFVALALAQGHPIWTNDKGLLRRLPDRSLSTKDVLDRLSA